jgi:hypothetical protein
MFPAAKFLAKYTVDVDRGQRKHEDGSKEHSIPLLMDIA